MYLTASLSFQCLWAFYILAKPCLEFSYLPFNLNIRNTSLFGIRITNFSLGNSEHLDASNVGHLDVFHFYEFKIKLKYLYEYMAFPYFELFIWDRVTITWITLSKVMKVFMVPHSI